jgi:hypothetical protein
MQGAAGVGGEKSMHIDCLFSSLQPPCTRSGMAAQRKGHSRPVTVNTRMVSLGATHLAVRYSTAGEGSQTHLSDYVINYDLTARYQ